ncbi:MAG: undecaprenyl-phosphate 4-deoxy-4-formamido-L-arabinose transferase [Candidatus Arsenophonus melophagi]|nr:undecaprenyl-phosphate 4-deoxy-4-formamido-L-arabinose transferase [Candidatus Arsenophonus melophagi]
MPIQHDFEKIKTVSIVIPIYNEEQSLPKLLERTLAACQRLEKSYELILVDDGSADNSVNLLIDAAENVENHVIAIILNRNYGQHLAIIAGFKQAIGDLVITLDADLQNPPEEIPNLVQVAEQGYDVIGTKRMNRKDSWFRKIASKIINTMITKTTGCTMGDYGCMLRAYRRNIINAILQCDARSTFIPILANVFARRTIEIDVAHSEREFGDSKYSFMKLINLMFDLLTCLTAMPLRLLSVIGSIISATGFLLAVLLIILRLMFGAIWAVEGVFTLFAILFIFIGAQFIAIGLLGEYIGRIYNDVSVKPRYFIQKIVSIDRDTNKHQGTK